jgi:hypothetical protein
MKTTNSLQLKANAQRFTQPRNPNQAVLGLRPVHSSRVSREEIRVSKFDGPWVLTNFDSFDSGHLIFHGP